LGGLFGNPNLSHPNNPNQPPLNIPPVALAQPNPVTTAKPKIMPCVPLLNITEQYIDSHTFFLIDFQTAVSMDFVHIPVEIGVLVFNGKKGEITYFHKFIDPGHIPKCYLPAVKYRKDIHGLNASKSDITEKSYKTLWKELCEFLAFDEKTFTKPQPNLFGTPCSVQNACLKWLAQKAGCEENIFGPVKPIEELISHIHKIGNHPIKSPQIQNYFLHAINNEAKLYKCKHHLKLESERAEELKAKGIQLQCSIAQVRYIGHILFSIINKEVVAKRSQSDRSRTPT